MDPCLTMCTPTVQKEARNQNLQTEAFLRFMEIQLIAAQGKVAWLSVIHQGFSGPLALPLGFPERTFVHALALVPSLWFSSKGKLCSMYILA